MADKYINASGITYLWSKIKESFLKRDDVADYIVETGSSELERGTWYYIKYNSGISECWGRFEYSGIEFEKASKNEEIVYEIGYFSTEPLKQESYPTSLFISPPTEIDTIVGGSGNGWLVSGGGNNTKGKTPSLTYIARFTYLSGTGKYIISRHAIGRWEE